MWGFYFFLLTLLCVWRGREEQQVWQPIWGPCHRGSDAATVGNTANNRRLFLQRSGTQRLNFNSLLMKVPAQVDLAQLISAHYTHTHKYSEESLSQLSTLNHSEGLCFKHLWRILEMIATEKLHSGTFWSVQGPARVLALLSNWSSQHYLSVRLWMVLEG